MVFGVERKYPLSYFSKHLLSPKSMWTFDDFRVCPVYWMLWSYAKSTLYAKSSAIRSGKVAKCYLLSVGSGCYIPHIYTEWPQLVVPHLNLSSVACLPGNITLELRCCNVQMIWVQLKGSAIEPWVKFFLFVFFY